MMKISEVMKITKLTKRAINCYEEEGLIKPDINPDNNYREYSWNEVDGLIQISALRQLDVPVLEIKYIISNPNLIRDRHEQHYMKAQLKNSGSDKINECLSILSSDYRKYKNNLEKF